MSAPRRVVLLGSGHSQVEVLRQFAMDRPKDCSLTVVTRDLLAPYSGMLPGYIAGHYAYHQCHIDVRPLAAMAGARVCHAEATAIDLDRRHVVCANRPAIPFDLLSINTGSRPTMGDIPGSHDYAISAKPVDEFIRRWQNIRDDLVTNPRPFRFVIVGAGAGGVELTLSLQHHLRTALGASAGELSFHIISDSKEILATHNTGTRRRMRRVLEERGIVVHENDKAVDVTKDTAVCQSGAVIPYDALIWTTHASPAPWIAASGMATDEHGFVAVNDRLQSTSHPFVFASGDVASLPTARPKSGVFAVREGPYLARNLRRHLEDRPLEPFTPQKEFLSLISTGDRNAIASRSGWSAQGPWVWRWKDYIDRKWMSRFQYTMAGMMQDGGMGANGENDEEPPCAGCGAKLGQSLLHDALARLDSVGGSEIVIGLDTPDDAAVIEPPPGKLAVHSVDFFPPIVDDAYIAGQIAANHCLSDLYAMGATPHTALATAVIPHADDLSQHDLLAEVLAGALAVLNAENATLVGGHTLEGERFLFGLSVNGFIAREELLHRAGLREGDRLVLTKALGTGVIFAADMRGRAETHWLDDAIAMMLHSNARAAQILRNHGVTACTDVTGFGLAGHLAPLLQDANCQATLQLDKLPILAGALQVSGQGFRSSLFPKNIHIETVMEQAGDRIDQDKYALLFDPQTSGGLLAGIPADRANDCVQALRDAGYQDAASIGTITAEKEHGPRIRVD